MSRTCGVERTEKLIIVGDERGPEMEGEPRVAMRAGRSGGKPVVRQDRLRRRTEE